MSDEPLRVLIVADDRRDCEAAGRALEQSGTACEIASVRSAEEALAQVRARPCDVVLIEHELAGMTGLAALQEMRATGLSVPVVFITAGGGERAAEALEAGAEHSVVKDAGGEYLKLLGVMVRKVQRLWAEAEHKRADEVLRESEERYKVVFEGSPEGILVADIETKGLRYANPAVCRMLGYTRDELTSLGVADIHPKDALAHVYSEFAAQARGEKTLASDIPCLTKDGRIIYADISTRKVRVDDRECNIGFVTDVTARRQAEAALRKAHEELERRVAERTADLARANELLRASLREKEVLLKEIHHRVKNNLQIVSSLLYLESRQIVDARAAELFRAGRDRVRSMAMIHERLYQSPDLARIDFAEYVRSLGADLLQSYGRSAGQIALRVDVGDVALGIDAAIPCGLIVNELVSNALKHAFPAGRDGEIRIALHPDSAGRLGLAVGDNGTGFPPDVDFRDAGGLGLRLVVALARQLDGTIELSRDGGTQLRVTFPREGADRSEQAAPPHERGSEQR